MVFIYPNISLIQTPLKPGSVQQNNWKSYIFQRPLCWHWH